MKHWFLVRGKTTLLRENKFPGIVSGIEPRPGETRNVGVKRIDKDQTTTQRKEHNKASVWSTSVRSKILTNIFLRDNSLGLSKTNIMRFLTYYIHDTKCLPD